MDRDTLFAVLMSFLLGIFAGIAIGAVTVHVQRLDYVY